MLLRRLALNPKSGYKTETAIVDADEVQKLRKVFSPQHIINFIKFNKTGEFLIRSETGKKMNKSNHYELSYRADWTNDYLEFNFSIPKYIYGTNIIMFTEHMNDVYYKYYENGLLEYNMKRAPKFLMSFLTFFLRNEFPLDKIDLKDVEINRIDVCFNQVLKTKSDALFFLKHQMKLRKKHSREEAGGQTNYETSFMYTTKRYSSKIYHKGTEFEKHDRKHLERINREKGHEFFKIDELQEFADRTIRYELTIRNGQLNYFYKHHIFRRECPFFKINYANYQRIGNTIKRNERIEKAVGQLEQSEKQEFMNLYPYEKITKNDRSTFKYVSNLMETIPKFMMEIDIESQICNKQTVTNKCETALFGEELISLCLKELYKFIKEYQLEELPNEDVLAFKIDHYNREHRKKLAKADLIQFYQLVIKRGSFKEAAIASRYSRATLFRYKDRFKKIGITENAITPEGGNSIPQAPLNFKGYHNFLTFQSQLLKGIKLPNFQMYNNDKFGKSF